MSLWFLASTGEDIIVTCNTCSYSANIELAQRRKENRNKKEYKLPKRPKTGKKRPGMRSVEEVSSFLGVEPSKLIKTTDPPNRQRSRCRLNPGGS